MTHDTPPDRPGADRPLPLAGPFAGPHRPRDPHADPDADPVIEPGRHIHTPASGPPSNSSVSREIYPAMGHEAIMRMMRDFYHRLATSRIARMFPADPDGLAEAAEKSGLFFVFLLGGPPLYQRQHGPPRMRMRHLPFRIDENARAEWLRCFRETLDDAPARYGFPPEHLPGFVAFLEAFSAWMVNDDGRG